METKPLDYNIGLPEETVDALVAQHGSNLYGFEKNDVIIVIKPFSKAQYRAMQTEVENENAKAERKQVHLSSYELAEKWVKATAVYPAKPEVDSILNEYPGLADVIAQDLTAIARMEDAKYFRKIKRTGAASVEAQG